MLASVPCTLTYGLSGLLTVESCVCLLCLVCVCVCLDRAVNNWENRRDVKPGGGEGGTGATGYCTLD